MRMQLQLIERRTPEGRATRLAYDGNGRLVRVEDETGQRFLAFGYDEQGRLVEVGLGLRGVGLVG